MVGRPEEPEDEQYAAQDTQGTESEGRRVAGADVPCVAARGVTCVVGARVPLFVMSGPGVVGWPPLPFPFRVLRLGSGAGVVAGGGRGGVPRGGKSPGRVFRPAVGQRGGQGCRQGSDAEHDGAGRGR
ncbi:hypothetical protein AV521_29885 [Streptomyces sp. IMTB 2501]|nr:hypothetical protein AV521_29885 [Streptomyces sp. IMTB 2501]